MTVWPVLVVVVEVWIVVIIVHVCALTLSLAFFPTDLQPPTPVLALVVPGVCFMDHHSTVSVFEYFFLCWVTCWRQR